MIGKIQRLLHFLREASLTEEAREVSGMLQDLTSDSGKITDKTIIYCDMDGVLVDFAKHAISDVAQIMSSGLENPLIKKNPAIKKTYLELIDKYGENWRPSDINDLEDPLVRRMTFKIISQNPGEWFQGLSPLKDGKNKLWSFINSLGYNVKILSAGVSGKKGRPTAEEGKYNWAMNNLSPEPQEVIVADKSSDKQKWAINNDGSSNILIDDKESNIEQWISAGGVGILHIPGNSDATIQKLRKIVNDFKN